MSTPTLILAAIIAINAIIATAYGTALTYYAIDQSRANKRIARRPAPRHFH